jgi:molybdopterin converting factor small subunit
MQIQVQYWNQLRAARGISNESVELQDSSTLSDLLTQVGQRSDVGELLLDEQGNLRPWILVDHCGTMVRDLDTELSDGDEIRLLSHISGG